MRLPLNNWATIQRGYRFGVPTFYNKFHIGLDLIVPTGRTVYAHLPGIASSVVGSQTGNCVHLVGSDGRLVRYAHLSRFGKSGAVNEGDIIGYTGNTGISTAPHLHVDVSKGGRLILTPDNFIDPEKYFKEGGSMASNEYNELVNSIKQVTQWIKDGNAARIAEITSISNRLNILSADMKALKESGSFTLSNDDQESVTWLTRVLKAIFSRKE